MSRSIIRWRRQRRRTSATVVIVIDLVVFCTVVALAALTLYVGTPAAVAGPFVAGVIYTAIRAATYVTGPLRAHLAAGRPAGGEPGHAAA